MHLGTDRPGAATLPLSGTAAVGSPRLDLPGEGSGALFSHPRRMDNGSLHVRWNPARVPVPLASGKEWTIDTHQKVSIRMLLVVAVCSLVGMLGPPRRLGGNAHLQRASEGGACHGSRCY